MRTEPSRSPSSARRRLAAIVVLLAATVVLGLAGLAAWAVQARPTIRFDLAEALATLEMDPDAPPRPATGGDGWPALRTILTVGRELDDDAIDRTAERVGALARDGADGPDPAAVRAELEELLARPASREVLAAMDTVAAAGDARADADGFTALIEGRIRLMGVRSVARLGLLDLKRAHARGDEAAVVARLDALYALVGACGDQPNLLMLLLGVAIEQRIHAEVRTLLAHHELSPALARALDEVIARHPSPDAAFALEGERRYLLDFVQRSFTDDGDGGGRFLPAYAGSTMVGGATTEPGAVERLANVAGLLAPGRRAVVASITDEFDAFRARLAEPAWTWASETAPVPRSGLSWKVLDLLRPSLGGMLEQVVTLGAHRHGIRVALAIHSRGALPDDLETLVAEGLPADAIVDPWTGRPLHYERDETAPGGYRLRSLGPDGLDQRGLPTSDDVDLTPRAD